MSADDTGPNDDRPCGPAVDNDGNNDDHDDDGIVGPTGRAVEGEGTETASHAELLRHHRDLASLSYKDLLNGFLDAHASWSMHEAGMRSIVVNGVGNDETDDDDDDVDDANDDEGPGIATEDNNADGCGAIISDPPTSSSSSSSSIATPLEILRDALLRPGMKFVGRIFIPGMSATACASENDGTDDAEHQGERSNAYELSILKRDVDALGNDFILAMHSAYDDEQAAHIHVKIVDASDNHHDEDGDDGGKRLEIEYSDGETVCRGKWNPALFRWEGRVYQRLHVNDGVYHSSDMSTHVFTLYPCTFRFPFGGEEGTVDPTRRPSMSSLVRDVLSGDTRAMTDHRSKTMNARSASLARYDELYRGMNITDGDIRALHRYCENEDGDVGHANADIRLDERQRLMLKLRDCDWAEMFNESVLLGECLCAEFRRRSSMLDDATFETFEDRERFATRWGGAKMDIVAAHASWDEWGKTFQRALAVVYLFADYNFARIFQIRHRIIANFECFDGAYRRASARLPRGDLIKYEVPRVRGGLINHACIICQSSLLEHLDDGNESDTRIYQLPCSHYFHEGCVKKWLHDHPSCPVCRYNLSKNAT